MIGLIESLTHAFTRKRLPSIPETALQDAIAACLTAASIPFEREVRLNAADRIDFVVAGELGLEVKVDGGLSEVTRQIHRYAQVESLSELLLVTTRMRHLALPRAFNGKRLAVCHLIGGSL